MNCGWSYTGRRYGLASVSSESRLRAASCRAARPCSSAPPPGFRALQQAAVSLQRRLTRSAPKIGRPCPGTIVSAPSAAICRSAAAHSPVQRCTFCGLPALGAAQMNRSPGARICAPGSTSTSHPLSRPGRGQLERQVALTKAQPIADKSRPASDTRRPQRNPGWPRPANRRADAVDRVVPAAVFLYVRSCAGIASWP